MATWHQQKAGLAGLYSKPPRGYRVVTDPPGQFASSIDFTRKRDAERFIRNTHKRTGYKPILIAAKP